MKTPFPFSPIKRALSDRMRREAGEATTLQEEHRLIRDMLDQLEAMADDLPTLPPQETLRRVIDNLREGIPAHCRHEETALGEQALPDDPTRTRALEILKREHQANEALASELAEALEEQLEGRGAMSQERLGYLTRHYFTLLRRHMEWEEYLIEDWLDRHI